jgi:glycine cleavage system H protein
MTPNDRKYAKTHEWVKLDGETAVLGITDYAQHSLGDVTFVELPAVGKKLKPGDSCGVVESVKAASDICAPLAGEVADVNRELEGTPGLINQDPYGRGWICKLHVAGAPPLTGLLDASQYEATLD